MSGMAEVLAAHHIRWVLTADPDYDERLAHVGKHVAECVTCGPTEVPESEHQATMLTAAGFGPVKEAAAAALAEAVEAARANNDHIVPGGDGYSAGFHYALHCIAPYEDEQQVPESHAVAAKELRAKYMAPRSCPTRLMDGRNEIRCWLNEGHQGDCR